MFIETFYGTYGSLDVTLRPRILDAVQIASTCGLIVLVLGISARWTAIRARWPIALFLVITAGSLIVFLNYVSYRALATGPPDPLIVGRYLNAGIALWAIAIAVTLWTLPRRASAIGAGLVLGGGALLQLDALASTLTRYFA